MYIGIDLGTTNSAIAGYNNTDVKIYKTAEGSDTLASVIYFDKRGHKLYGKRAYDRTLLSPENVAHGFKRLMGSSTPIDIKSADLSLTAEQCSADILKQLVGQFYTETGMDQITGTVITIPAAFNQMQSEATIRAANMAGLEKVVLLQEPIAAAMSAISSTTNKNGQFLIYDLGGGTFDLALVQSIKGTTNIIAHEGINMLGGRDFDRMIVDNFVRPWLLDNFDMPANFQKQAKYRKVISMARLKAEEAKIDLSARNTTVIFASDEDIRVQDKNGNDIYIEIEFTRTDLDNLIAEEIQKTIKLSNKILKDNGYTNEDIDRIVFIGGPTKMPCIREVVPQQLGIPADLDIDPMTAVAKGAAIYCESREWNDTSTARKSTRASHKSQGKINIQYDYPSRSSDDTVKIRITTDTTDSAYEIEFNNTAGWTSGRVKISDKTFVKLSLNEMGANDFTAMVFDTHGKPVKDNEFHFTITRTHATAASVPATQTIAVEVRDGRDGSRNKLTPLIKKGTNLPASGSQKFITTKQLHAELPNEKLAFGLYQDEGAPEPHLNLSIGVFEIESEELEQGMKIKEGDEIIFHWEMSDSGILKATVELPLIEQSFDTPKFYTDQAGHQAFDLDNGPKLANSILDEVEQELNAVQDAIGENVEQQCSDIQQEITAQKENLQNANEPEDIRNVTEKARYIRQEISKIKHSPENRGKILKQDIMKMSEIFDESIRSNTDKKTAEQFDSHEINALVCLDKKPEPDIKQAEEHLEQMKNIIGMEIWNDKDFLIAVFKSRTEQSYLATDRDQYELHIQRGLKAIKYDDMTELRKVIFALDDLQMNVGGNDKNSIGQLADIISA